MQKYGITFSSRTGNTAMLENFDRALSHPDGDDLQQLEQKALAVMF